MNKKSPEEVIQLLIESLATNDKISLEDMEMISIKPKFPYYHGVSEISEALGTKNENYIKSVLKEKNTSKGSVSEVVEQIENAVNCREAIFTALGGLVKFDNDKTNIKLSKVLAENLVLNGNYKHVLMFLMNDDFVKAVKQKYS